MKRLIITILLLLALCGCERTPYVRYEADANIESLDMKVYVKDGYVLNQGHRYDEVETENGYDLVLHFIKEEGADHE